MSPALIRSAIAVLPLLAVVAGCACSAPTRSTSGLPVTQTELGDQWPLTVPQATILCGEARRLMLQVGDTTYWLNGLAKGDDRWADLNRIWAPDPEVSGLKKSMGPLTDKALAYCQDK